MVFNEKFNNNLIIDLDFYGSSPVCKFEAKCTKNLVKELLTTTEKQYINYFENQVEYKLSEKSSLMQS